MAQNLLEKIAQQHAVGLPKAKKVQSGDYLSIRPAHVLTHDNTGAVMKKFARLGATRMADPRQPVFALDHNVQDCSQANLDKYAAIERFAEETGVDFYPAGRGIGHQIMIEEGYAFPGTMSVASDSHANMYGGIGCLGTPVVRTDAAALWATGRTWWQVPPVAQVVLSGKPAKGVSGKDIIITLCGLFHNDEVLNHAVEFAGDGVAHLSVEERLTIANMTTEWGALAGLFPIDARTLEWLHQQVDLMERRGRALHPRLNRERLEALEREALQPDEGAFYFKKLRLELPSVRPHVSGPNQVKHMSSLAEIETQNIAIQKAYLVSCVNSRVTDLAAAAAVLRGKKVAQGVELYVAAASSEVHAESERRGDWQALMDAGARPLPPGCGPCIGLGEGLLHDGEVGISATNRNFKGRMGSPSAQAYLASPAVVAASALSGKIACPEPHDRVQPVGSIELSSEPPSRTTEPLQLLAGFPERLKGSIVFCHQDNLNTDGIFPGKYTYIDDFSPEQQARVAMENYDPKFQELVQEGDILVGGFNFGSGSSREQAVTALQYRGLRMVLAGSFSETYKRNALNNGFLVIEAPELVRYLKQRFGASKPTVRTELTAEVDFSTSRLTVGERTYSLAPIGPPAQELIVEGGLENWVKKRLDST